MNLVLTLLVRDEEDILEAFLDYHFAQGVDHIIVTDNLSVDRTAEILAEYEEEGNLTTYKESQDDYDQAQWVTRMAREAFNHHGADWVINSDADEFWWPKSHQLKTVLAAIPSSVDTLSVPRTNFLPTRSSSIPFFERMLVREMQSVNDLGRPLPPKVIHRGRGDVEIAQGNHSVRGHDAVDASRYLEILHFPIRSYPQLENKIKKGGAAYLRSTHPPEVGDVWRQLYGLLRQGQLRDYFEDRCRTADEIQESLVNGSLVHDVRLRDVLRELRTDALGPSSN